VAQLNRLIERLHDASIDIELFGAQLPDNLDQGLDTKQPLPKADPEQIHGVRLAVSSAMHGLRRRGGVCLSVKKI